VLSQLPGKIRVDADGTKNDFVAVFVLHLTGDRVLPDRNLKDLVVQNGLDELALGDHPGAKLRKNHILQDKNPPNRHEHVKKIESMFFLHWPSCNG
jgi:hypothetical protein